MSIRQKQAMAAGLGKYFLDKGKILSEQEYRQLSRAPYRFAAIKQFFGSWPRAVDGISIHAPKVWEELNAPKEVPMKPLKRKTTKKKVAKVEDYAK